MRAERALRLGAIGLVLTALEARAAEPPLVKAEAQPLDVAYCADEKDDPYPSTRVRVRLDITHTGDVPAIVARPTGGIEAVHVASTLADLEREVFVSSIEGGLRIDSEEDIKRTPKFVVTPSPDPARFVVLAGAESFEETLDVGLHMARGEPPVTGVFLAPGETYWVEVDVNLWPNLRSSEEEVARATKTWQDHGRLQTGIVTARFPVHLPPVTRVRPCPEPSGR
jgi:hypothetical protein